MKSRILLSTTIDDTRRAELRLARANERISTLNNDIPTIEAKLAELMEDLNQKRQSLQTTQEEAKEMEDRIHYNLDKKNGLCIRTLNKHQLGHVFSFLAKDDEIRYTCKYWNLIFKEVYNHPTNTILRQQSTDVHHVVQSSASRSAHEDVLNLIEPVVVAATAAASGVNSRIHEDIPPIEDGEEEVKQQQPIDETEEVSVDNNEQQQESVHDKEASNDEEEE